MNGEGQPLAFTITPGQVHDSRIAESLLAPLPAPDYGAGDTAYDSNALRHFMQGRGTTPVIPNNPRRKHRHPFDAEHYKRRNLIERAIGRLKDWRRIATRYDKLAANYASAVAIAIVLTWWC